LTVAEPLKDKVHPLQGVAVTATVSAKIDEATADGTAVDEAIVSRILSVPRDVGWMMVSIGVVGVILPGVIGAPFLAAGIAVLAPGGPRVLTRWISRNPNRIVSAGVRQMGRWLDDLERRYPKAGPS
jgi:hypothetical protein